MRNTLMYLNPAKKWEESLPVGNGRIGAMVFGNLRHERIALNEDTLWSGYPKEGGKEDAYMHLKDIQEAIFEGRHKDAKRIANEDMHGDWSDCYLPFGDLKIDYSKKLTTKEGYSRYLDMSTGVATAVNDKVKQTVFVSAVDSLLVVHLESTTEIECDISLESQLYNRCFALKDGYAMKVYAPDVCYPVYYHDKKPIVYGSKAPKGMAIVKVTDGAGISDKGIHISGVKETTIVVSLATSFVGFKSMPDADDEQRALSYLDNIKSYDELLNDHMKDFSELFNRVDIVLGQDYSDIPTDKRLENFKKGNDDYDLMALLFQYARYLTISASRPGTTAMNLQGIFNEHLRAPWSSNYTININTEMNYWCTDVINLSECFEPFWNLTKQLVENGEKTAKRQYGCSGSVAHHNSDIWAMTWPAGDPKGKDDSESYALWQSALPWMLNEVYTHYVFTKDENMFEEMKPYFKKVLDFYSDFLVEHNGVNVVCPNISPENMYMHNGQKAALTYMPTMDIGILQEFFANCQEMGFNTPSIPDIPIGSDGRINEWAEEFEETEKTHRHVSHLYCVYPSRFEQSEEIRNAAKKSLEVRGFGGTGWALGWKVCLFARLDESENALRLIKEQLTPIRPGIKSSHGGTYPNMLDAHPPFQIDGNFGVAAGIAEMFIRRNIPKEWSGHIQGLRDHNGNEIAFEFSNGRILEK